MNARVPDTLDCLLRTFSRAQAAIERATVYHPRIGRRTRAYLSAGDAMAYEYGYEAWPIVVGLVPGTPRSTGWLDAEADAQEREDARRELAAEAREQAE